MTYLLATQNAGKVREFRRVLRGVDLVVPAELGLTVGYREDEPTFLGNALGKARSMQEESGLPTIADDSGLVVAALSGGPGVLSARYGGDITTIERNALLLQQIVGDGDRAATFVCCVVIALGPERFIAIQETVDGRLADHPRGAAGFWYDPIFLPAESLLTFAEMSDAEKDALSHRGRALRRCAQLLQAGFS